MRYAWLLLGALALVGCQDELENANTLVKPRVLGTRASVDDTGRTNPRPGETVTLDWIVEFPGVREPSTFVFFACEPASTAFGVDFCADDDEMIALELGLTPTLDAPRFEITIPDDYATNSVLILGAICMGGDIDTEVSTDDPGAEVCRDGVGRGQIVTLTHQVVINDRQENIAPTIDEILLDGEAWTAMPPEDPSGGCDASSGFPTYRVDGEDAVIVLRASEREEFEVITGDPPGPEPRVEDLQTSYLSTAGDLDQTFGFIDDINPESEVEWTPTESDDEDMDVPEAGLIVKFVFVTRDLRGGVDTTTRALCLTR